MTPVRRGELALNRLREVLDYDAATGVLTRKKTDRIHWRFVGLPAGHVTPSGYISVSIDGVEYRAHRLAWLLAYGEWPSDQIDHINGNRQDNRLANLREATHALNAQNRQSLRSTNKSGLPGVSLFKRTGRWAATISVAGRTRSLGTFTTREEAHEAYVAAKRELHPFWAADAAAT